MPRLQEKLNLTCDRINHDNTSHGTAKAVRFISRA